MRNNKLKFDKVRLPMTFYAHTMQFIERDAADGRCTVSFEAVEKEEVEMFVTGERPKKFSNTAEQVDHFSTIWENFQKGGLNSPAFVDNKAEYLGKVGNAQLNLLFHSFARAMSIANAKQDWWEITVLDQTVSEKEDGCMVQILGYEESEEEYAFAMQPVSKELEENLYHLYTHYNEPERKKREMKAIAGNTVFQEIQVLYVGAALCCCLVDNGGNPVGYFDMGIESAYSNKQLRKGNPNYPLMKAQSTQAYWDVRNDMQNFGNQTVIISHWHTDHLMILTDVANEFINHNNYANFWQSAEFIYPGIHHAKSWAVTYYTILQSALQRANNQNIITMPYQNVNHNTMIFNTMHIQIYKCDRNDINLGTPNPHDHGIWAAVQLQSGNIAFLAGDCAYDTIGVGNPAAGALTNQNQGFPYLVASHHGGKYTHTTAQNKVQYIPAPLPPPSLPEVFFSANGVAYGHPKLANITAYGNRGWTARRTDQLPLVGSNLWSLT